MDVRIFLRSFDSVIALLISSSNFFDFAISESRTDLNPSFASLADILRYLVNPVAPAGAGRGASPYVNVRVMKPRQSV